MRLRKFFAKLFIILGTFFVVLSPIVLVEEAHHHCNHEECQICEVIRTAKETIKQIKTPSATKVVVAIAPLFALFAVAIVATVKNKDFSTLITLKTKMSN